MAPKSSKLAQSSSAAKVTLLARPAAKVAQAKKAPGFLKDGAGAGVARGKNVTVELGKDQQGQALVGHSESAYTREQMHVANKAIQQSPTLAAAWEKCKTKAEKRQFVHSMVPSDAGFIFQISIKEADAVKWLDTTTGGFKNSSGVQRTGLTETEMLSQLGWREDKLHEGIEKGDIIKKGNKYISLLR